MIVISSARALSDSAEIARNQVRANISWQKVFDEIIYFSGPEPALDCPKTTFIQCEDFPTIQLLAQAASMSDDFAFLINADIVVSTGLIPAMRDVWSRGGLAVTSHRWEFKGEDLANASVVDNGVDFFGATPDLWRDFSMRIPPDFRCAHAGWDSWAMAFFNTVAFKSFWDITKRRVIYHPKHGNRKTRYTFVIKNDEYTRNAGFPRLKL